MAPGRGAFSRALPTGLLELAFLLLALAQTEVAAGSLRRSGLPPLAHPSREPPAPGAFSAFNTSVPVVVDSKVLRTRTWKEPNQVVPQIFLLFLAYSNIQHLAIWESFLNDGVRGVEYTAVVHCKDEAECRKNLENSPRFLVIPSVATSYCHDLVSGMNALVRSAVVLGGIGSPNDKFVFVSDSTLPVKPFAYIRDQLTADQASDFCIFPRNEWAEVSDTHGHDTVKIAPKHHQWMVLSRKHAELSAERSSQNMDLMQQLQLNMLSTNAGWQNTGCLDEFWHFATIYNSLLIKPDMSQIPLEDFNGGPLNTRDFEIQGRCNTFVEWVQRAAGISNNITHLAQALTVDAGTDLAPATQARPGSIHRFGRASLRALRKSPFLFARKVSETASFSGCESLEEAFSAHVFRAPEHDVASEDGAWPGTGIWVDNQNSRVSINSFEGAVRLGGEHKDMQAKGFYCGSRIEITFNSGYKTSAVLSEDKMKLHWANGVVWPRVTHGL
mmetsp:Transcript_152928/g.490607  ORF Transcript_152928/g.490607 Transcript_152928/m.490607 type:complete len:499 (-) Transcript_152928:97-1593(-)